MLERLIQLEENLGRLEVLRSERPAAGREASTTAAWAVRYGLIESTQIVIDTACALCARHNLGAPRSYGDCLRLLGEAGYIPQDLAKALAKVVGLRNLLIHEYVSVDQERIVGFLGELDVFRAYAAAVRPYLAAEGR